MQQQEKMYMEFTRLTRVLNRQLQIVPILYGSTGLSRTLHADLEPRDIDMLIPRAWLEEGISMLAAVMEEDGYSPVDETRRIYAGRSALVKFSPQEDMLALCKTQAQALHTTSEHEAEFMELPLRLHHIIYQHATEQPGNAQAKYMSTLSLIERIGEQS